MPFECDEARPHAPQIPHPRRLGRRGHDMRPVRAERGGADLTVMPFEGDAGLLARKFHTIAVLSSDCRDDIHPIRARHMFSCPPTESLYAGSTKAELEGLGLVARRKRDSVRLESLLSRQRRYFGECSTDGDARAPR
jgi:hypothetical protein